MTSVRSEQKCSDPNTDLERSDVRKVAVRKVSEVFGRFGTNSSEGTHRRQSATGNPR
jgi:hypothetical protein